MEYRDYYATLGVPRTASQADIRKAFRRLAREHHPDVNKGDTGAEQRFKEVSEANEVLSDPEKRKAYDQLGANWEAYQRAGAGAAARTPSQGFGGCRGLAGSAASASSSTGTPTISRASATSSARSSPVVRPVARRRHRLRPAGAPGRPASTRTSSRSSAASGATSGPATPPRASARAALADVVPTVRASRSDATATTTVSLEEVMTGTERVLQVGGKRLEVKVPPGVRDGQRIRLSGKADGGGDIYLTVAVEPHRTFTPRRREPEPRAAPHARGGAPGRPGPRRDDRREAAPADDPGRHAAGPGVPPHRAGAPTWEG